MSNKELSSLPYSSLTNEHDKSENQETTSIDPTTLNKWIKNIINDDDTEDELITQVANLHNTSWTDLGALLATEHDKTIKELQQLREQKDEVSTRFEAELDKMMQQVETNDRIVEGKLRNLRSFGTQMLGGVNGVGEGK